MSETKAVRKKHSPQFRRNGEVRIYEQAVKLNVWMTEHVKNPIGFCQSKGYLKVYDV